MDATSIFEGVGCDNRSRWGSMRRCDGSRTTSFAAICEQGSRDRRLLTQVQGFCVSKSLVPLTDFRSRTSMNITRNRRGRIIAPDIIGDAEHLPSLSAREVYHLIGKRLFIGALTFIARSAYSRCGKYSCQPTQTSSAFESLIPRVDDSAETECTGADTESKRILQRR
jgi:hypothetical protein